ncbi:MAG TPA: hypothetical protein VJ997_14835, partial [Longimicrobiales bacterium]|nr:hypothetical protein [Longimicrobiales bacterium]
MKGLNPSIVLLAALTLGAVACDSEPLGLADVPDAQFAKPADAGPGMCTTIQSGELLNSAGDVIGTGYDPWGYNYQARMFNGLYCDSYRDAAWCQPYKDVRLLEKWNEAWLGNQDCDGDGLLDRHLGFDSYIGSGAWLTNHQSGEDIGPTGEACTWSYFVKIVAAPA